MAVDSDSGFNSPGYKEYDPTPYGGGYNFTLTYGKPLAPSDSICYPPSISKPDVAFPNGFSYSSIPNPYVNDIVIDFETRKTPQPQNEYPPNRPQKEEEKAEQGFGGDNGNWVYEPYRGYWGEDVFSNGYGDAHESDYGKPVDSNLGEKGNSEKRGYSQSDFDYEPLSSYGYGRGEDKCDKVGRQVPPPPVDDPGPCAGLFGYFPCLSKKDQKLYTDHGGGDEQGCRNQSSGTAEYLFGRNLYPYGENSMVEDVSYRYPCYAYERHCPELPHHVQVDYTEQPHYVQVDYNEQPHYVHYNEQPHYVQVDYNEQPHYVQADYNEQLHYVQADYNEQPHYVQADYNEQPHYVQANYNQSHYVQVEYIEQPKYVQVEYNEQPLFQSPGCNGAYQDDEYPQSNYGDDSYINHQYFYYNQSGYTVE